MSDNESVESADDPQEGIGQCERPAAEEEPPLQRLRHIRREMARGRQRRARPFLNFVPHDQSLLAMMGRLQRLSWKICYQEIKIAELLICNSFVLYLHLDRLIALHLLILGVHEVATETNKRLHSFLCIYVALCLLMKDIFCVILWRHPDKIENCGIGILNFATMALLQLVLFFVYLLLVLLSVS